MTAKSYSRGHPIEYTKNGWVYSDNKESIKKERLCIRCKKMPTKDGHDACLGKIKGVSSACCGHGVEPGYSQILKKEKQWE